MEVLAYDTKTLPRPSGSRNDLLISDPLCTGGELEKQTQFAGLWPEIRNPKLEIRDATKQSQFHPGLR